MPTENIIAPDRVLDVREIPCSSKHGLIFKTWQDLPVGEYFILWNHRDPVPLRNQFSTYWPGTFAWEYLVKQPEEVRIKITKLKDLGEWVTPVALNCGGH